MGRPRNIDRNQVLNAAEQIVLTRGAAEMTIDAVARASGITKGGVQYCFGNKDGLIDAMVERWLQELSEQIYALTHAPDDAAARVCASIELTARLEKLSDGRAATMMAMLVQTPERLERMRKWYRDHLRGLDLSTPAGRSIRLAFIAMEGAFMLRSFGLMKMSAAGWNELFSEIKALLPQQLPTTQQRRHKQRQQQQTAIRQTPPAVQQTRSIAKQTSTSAKQPRTAKRRSKQA